ncbi:methyltransferase [Methylobacterium sp. 092160098-2]|uniref:methyltransferase n=1 Tax=Methylobacterium sp. 092160098-2 TaxID=3025129 RepID=UPI002381A968|nr:methyltransferase [Methylobacterium sp. 092160098-2]MDE4915128.1 methyltransferase [Methylobacterium sp. 092160098-2]
MDAKKIVKIQEQIRKIRSAVWQAHALETAVVLDLAELLADGPLSLAAVAERSGTHAPSLYRLLRALESDGFFSQVSPEVFANTDASTLLRRDFPGSQRALILSHLSDIGGHRRVWSGLTDAVRTGNTAFEKVHGCDLWEFGRRNPEAARLFNQSMQATSSLITPAVTNAYDWQQFPVIADIGGGIGTQLLAILDQCRNVRGLLFDKPEIAVHMLQHPRLTFLPGDFFVAVPGGADAYLLRWIMHDYADDKACKILTTVRRAMKPGARLLVVDAVVPTGPEPSHSKWTDLLMLVVLGGCERTLDQFCSLFTSAGFQLDEVIETGSPLKILVASCIPSA